MTLAARRARTQQADTLCGSAFAAATTAVAGRRSPAGAMHGVALVAVGGYGRRELAPRSDLDLVLVHTSSVDVDELATRLWYPLWDAGVQLDHSVRALEEVTEAAADDVRVALGLLDARHVAGDSSITLRLHADVLAGWRRDARRNLPRLRELVHQRQERVGELAHASVPDLKESYGGLRDTTALKAMVATWLVDVPHVDLERCRLALLDIRDVLHDRSGRSSDRVGPELWDALAAGLELPDRLAAQQAVRRVGRRVVQLSRLTWSRVEHVMAAAPGAASGAAPGAPRPRRGPELVTVAPGVAVCDGEVVLAPEAAPAGDPVLLLRAAAAAAEHGAMIAPASLSRLASASTALPEPWPAEARELFVRLLASGPGLPAVWETLDETGALALVLPEWAQITLLPHASVIHRFTVDRHVTETCVQAAQLIRRVARPDLLVLAAVLHDIGKGSEHSKDSKAGGGDHSKAGEPIAEAVTIRMGFPAADVATVARLVRWHLLLTTTATSRDLDDPATISAVAGCVGNRETLDLLEVLTEADARATSAQAWTSWRARLVRDLASRVRHQLSGSAPPVPWTPEDLVTSARSVGQRPGAVHVDVEDGRDEVGSSPGSAPGAAVVSVVAQDRSGLLAATAGALAVLGVAVRTARVWTGDQVAVLRFEIDGSPPDPALVAGQVEAVLAGRSDPATRLRGRGRRMLLPPVVLVDPHASRHATVLEVRTDDHPGVLYRVCQALAGQGLAVRSAHVTTVGPQALDVFYVQTPEGVGLAPERAADSVHAVRRALESAATLDL